MRFRFALLCLGAAALCGATTINFDDVNASGGNVALTTNYDTAPYDNVTFGSDANGTSGCTTTTGCGFVIKDAANTTNDTTETSPNFVALTGNTGADLTITFGGPVTLTSLDLLGFGPNSTGSFYDGATVQLFNSSNTQIGSNWNIGSISGGSSAVSPSTYDFSSGVSNVSYIVISKANTNTGLFGFDDLTYTPSVSGIPEPASFLLIGSGMMAVLFARRRAKR